MDMIVKALNDLYNKAMKLSPEEMKDLADKIDDKAESLRMVARDVEKRNDKQD